MNTQDIGTIAFSPLSAILRRPEYAIPLFSLALYFAASWYLDGYAGVFNAHASWFSPSVFSLVAFSGAGILFAAVSLVVYLFVLDNAGNGRRWWWIWWLLWGAFLVRFTYVTQDGFAQHQKFQDRLGIVSQSTILLFTPLLSYFSGQWMRRHLSRIDKDIAEVRDATERLKRGDDVDQDTLKALKAKAEKLQRFGREESHLPAEWFLLSIYLFAQAMVMHKMIYSIGFSHAAADVARLNRLMPTPDIEKASTPLTEALRSRVRVPLFTDGNASIDADWIDGRLGFFYTNGNDAAPRELVTSMHLSELITNQLDESLKNVEKAMKELESVTDK